MKKMNLAIIILLTSAIFWSCTSTREHKEKLGSTQERELTVGVVQKEIKKGMSGADVTQVLGSPNIVTKDDNENETWVYDKIATEASYSESQTALFLILGGSAEQSGAKSVTQKTLTVIIKFDGNGKVSTFSYHSTKF
jgi:outer membrane protein assembly factor BamE (lipoprotein component of BamABCDE complex)